MKLNAVRATADLLGDKWTPQLICAIAQSQSIRFCQLQDKVGNINPRTLTARLIQLEDNGIITKDTADYYPSYSLTERGQGIIPILAAMSNWSDKYSTPV